jgi:mannose-6-phosphate isomerase
MNPYPLKFRPIFKERIWGGRKLADVFGKELPAGRKIGESWELADLPGDKSVIVNGELAGMNIGEAVTKYPLQIMGKKKFAGQFPLLLKILDAEDVLSVQVHPDEETCRRMGRGEPKTECWYIISAEPGAVIYKGLKGGVTRNDFEAGVRDGTVSQLLGKVAVHEGECHMLPAGTPHAIGAGLLIAEVQTPSDTTYRVFDWGRVDNSGQARELHIAEALESIHFTQEQLPVTTVGRLVDSRYFKVDKGHQARRTEVLFSGKMKVVMVMAGGGSIIAKNALSVEFVAGDTILIPSRFEGAGVFSMETQYLTITLDAEVG